jgi:hypothetical protein
MLFYNIFSPGVGFSERKNVLLRRGQNNDRITALRFVYAFVLVIQFCVYPRITQILFTISSNFVNWYLQPVIAGELGRSHIHSRKDKAWFYISE